MVDSIIRSQILTLGIHARFFFVFEETHFVFLCKLFGDLAD
jgi:hypothetical protein